VQRAKSTVSPIETIIQPCAKSSANPLNPMRMH